MIDTPQHEQAHADTGKCPENGHEARWKASYFNPSMESLVSKYLEYRGRVEQLSKKRDEDRTAAENAEMKQSLCFCQNKLTEVQGLLFPSSGMRSRSIAAWQLLHRVSEELILLMTSEELKGFGIRLKRDISTTTIPEVVRKEWIDCVGHQLTAIAAPSHSFEQVRATRQIFKNIYCSLNGIVDDLFWDLWAKKFLAFCYTTTLALLTLLFLLGEVKGGPCLSLDKVLLLGAMGGLMSGIFTGERESMPKGHFWIPTLYHLLVRPLMGLLAALVIFWAAESQFLVAVEPPYSGAISPCQSDSGNTGQPVLPELKSPVTATKDEKGVKVTTVTMKARAGKEHYLYMLLFLCAGFAGDKLLKAIADRVTERLISRAEKTREPKE